MTPVALEHGRSDEDRQKKGCGADEETKRHGNDGKKFDEGAEHADGNRNVILVTPVGNLILDAFAAVPAECMLGAVEKKSHCQAKP